VFRLLASSLFLLAAGGPAKDASAFGFRARLRKRTRPDDSIGVSSSNTDILGQVSVEAMRSHP
jgi:hypothetical protein